MSLDDLVATASDKEQFLSLNDYMNFCQRYLDFVATGLQAVIVAQNENNYQFYQYKADGHFNISRPLNADLMVAADEYATINHDFPDILDNVRDIPQQDTERRRIIIRAIYSIQQSIGAALDALPAGSSNTARKINGDLFERFIRLIIQYIGIHCEAGTMQVPVKVEEEVLFYMRYQHDLLLYDGETLKAIGSVKTSSKDRIDKIFIDKLLYSKLTGTALPHIAIFLNDVQRKKTRKENQYNIGATFLPGHFQGYTVKLNPLDGVYYCDIRSNMRTEPILKDHIQTIDYFLCDDIWALL